MLVCNRRSSWLFAPVCLVAMGVALWHARPASGQACLQWQAGDGVHGTNGSVHAAVMWDPDGPGARTPVLVIGGGFTMAGNALASFVAQYDPATGAWSSVGAGVNGIVRALASTPGGDLIVGGDFSQAGGAPASAVARWNGTSWSAMGGGRGPSVQALAIAPNGDAIAGGDFPGGVARWDGSAWSTVGAGTNGTVSTVLVLGNADIVAGGRSRRPGATRRATSRGGTARPGPRWARGRTAPCEH